MKVVFYCEMVLTTDPLKPSRGPRVFPAPHFENLLVPVYRRSLCNPYEVLEGEKKLDEHLKIRRLHIKSRFFQISYKTLEVLTTLGWPPAARWPALWGRPPLAAAGPSPSPRPPLLFLISLTPQGHGAPAPVNISRSASDLKGSW